MSLPTVGRIVQYVLPDGPHQGEQRPALIVRVWSTECVNLQVFTDGLNDGVDYQSGMVWKTSIMRDEDHKGGTWDWPMR